MGTTINTEVINSLNTIASATRMTSNINTFSFLLRSPQTVFFSVVAIIIMCAVLYVLVEFFSKNRFRGISLNVFSKLITVTDYINEFNKQLYNDFKNIKEYHVQSSTNETSYKLDGKDYKNKVYFIDNNTIIYKEDADSKESITVLDAIKRFMIDGNIQTQKDFNQKINNFFHPNPSLKRNIEQYEIDNLKSIFEALYGEEFHKKFSDWFNYDSIWNFAYKDSSSLDTNLLTLKIHNSPNSDGTNDEIPNILKETIDGKGNDDKGLKEYILENDFDSAMTKMEDYMNGIKSLISQKATNKILDNMVHEWKEKISELTAKFNSLDEGEEKNKTEEEINAYKKKITDLENVKSSLMKDVNSLFFSNSPINYESISQQLNESCSLLNDDAKDKFLKEFNEMSIGQGKLKNIVESMSFINVLDALRKSNYNVTHTTLRGINNIHPHIIEVFESINVDSKREEKASILYNACFEVFNEFIYTKYIYNGVGEFMFLEANDVNDLSKNDLYNNVLQYFNVHMILLYKENIKFAKHFTTDKDKFDKITDAHVSIARLKYLIQDYFVIIMEYNDKSFPDKKDIRDFWQKRVNSFGISMPGTKKFNRPRDAPDIDYVATRTNRSRKNKSGERRKLFNEDGNVMDDLDQVLKKNTPFELYKEYFKALFGTRHPRIPFFQSIIAGFRFMFPDPNTVLDNFLAQLKGKPPPPSNKQINWDFSFKYNPYTRVIDGMVDRFSDPELGVDKMEDVVDVTTHDSSGVGKDADDKGLKMSKAGARAEKGASAGTSPPKKTSEPGLEDSDSDSESKPKKCSDKEKKVKKRGGYECVPKTKKELAMERARDELKCVDDTYKKVKKGGRNSIQYECVPKTKKELAIEKAKIEANCGKNQYPKYRQRINKVECVDIPTKRK